MPETIIIVNFHGGLPSAMVQKAMHGLPSFYRIYRVGSFYSHVYCTNACPSASFHDWIMDLPIGCMLDHVNYSWGFSKKGTRTIFHAFKEQGYTTALFGSFGLKDTLDPQKHPLQESTALQDYGIDYYVGPDVTFTSESARAHDERILRAAADHLATQNTQNTQSCACIINLQACVDLKKCAVGKVDLPPASLNLDERSLPKSVFTDNARHMKMPSYEIQALRRAASFSDWAKKIEYTPFESPDLIFFGAQLYAIAWSILQSLDQMLGEFFIRLEELHIFDECMLTLMCDHPLSLYQHGVFSEAPWDACTRGFVCIKGTEDYATEREYHPTKRSLKDMARILRREEVLACSRTHPCITLGLSQSRLSYAFLDPSIDPLPFQVFFIKNTVTVRDRNFSVTVWFSLSNLVEANEIQHVTDVESDTIWMLPIVQQKLWKNPIIDDFDQLPLQLYELQQDPEELCNLAKTEFTLTDLFVQIKESFLDDLATANLQTFYMNFPMSIEELHPKRFVWNQPDRHQVSKTRNISIQTDTMSLRGFITIVARSDVYSHILKELPVSGNLTLFVPDKMDKDKWPEWAPFAVLYELDILTLKHMAMINDTLIDMKKNAWTMSMASDDSDIFIGTCRIVTESIRKLSYEFGSVTQYVITRRSHVTPNLPTSSSVASQSDSTELEKRSERSRTQYLKSKSRVSISSTKGSALTMEKGRYHRVR